MQVNNTRQVQRYHGQRDAQGYVGELPHPQSRQLFRWVCKQHHNSSIRRWKDGVWQKRPATIRSVSASACSVA